MAAFRDALAFCSNFYPAPIVWKGKTYPTSEHLFQACKCVLSDEARMIRLAETPGKAKRLGGKIQIRPDWNAIRVDTMRQIVKLKFEQHPELMALLKATGNQYLCEENEWGDQFWGKSAGIGCNWLGRILMEVRSA